ncbi:hypothetical protein BJX65DRAFT_313800 [Aspergillus insuetus]
MAFLDLVLHRGLNQENDVRLTSLFLAIEHSEVARLLLEKIQEQGIPTLGGPLLRAAAACGSESLLWKPLEDGHKLDATDGAECWTNRHDWFYSRQERLQKYTPLVWAAKFGDEDVVRLLLLSGAKPSPLALVECAKSSKSMPVAQLLMKAGLDPRMCHALHERSDFDDPLST